MREILNEKHIISNCVVADIWNEINLSSKSETDNISSEMFEFVDEKERKKKQRGLNFVSKPVSR